MRNKILLLIIITVAFLTRLVWLDQFPNGFTGDEAQQGYSAYSILKTGKDEWGEVLPIFPRGFGDFKPPLYTYLTVPSVAILGLTVEAIRLPAAILGILTVVVVFFLVRELFNETVAFWSSFLLTISPWHIQISRTAFEANAGILFFSLGLLFFLKWLKNGQYLLWVSFFWGLTLYTYDAHRFFMAIFILVVVFFYRQKLFKKINIFPGVLILIFILPIIFNIKSAGARAIDVGIINPKVVEDYFKNKGQTPLPPVLDRFLDNKVMFLGNQFFGNYFSYYSPTFFFSDSRPDSSYLNFPYFSLLYPIEIIFWLIAGYVLFTQKLQHKKLLILWLLLAPLAASLATDSMNANRAPTFLPLTAIISGLGAASLVARIKQINILIVIILLSSFISFGYFYLIKLPQKSIYNLRYGYSQVFQKIISVESQFDEIVISKVFTEPQIFVAFYGKVDPKIFQKNAQDWLRYEKSGKSYVDQLESWNLEKYLFEDINWQKKDSFRKNALVISAPGDFPEHVHSLLDLKDPKGKVIYRLISTKENL